MKNIFINATKLIAFSVIACVAFLISSSTSAEGSNIAEFNTGMMAAPLIASSTNRAAYNRFRRYLVNNRYIGEKSQPIITQTDLRLESVLVNTSSTIEWEVLKGVGSTATRPLEMKLESDGKSIFFISSIALCIQKQDANTVGGNQANYPLFTYNDGNYFNQTGESTALETLYQGKLTMSTSTQKRMEDFPTHHLKYVPNKAYEPTGVTGQTTAAEFPQYGPELSERGYFEFDPNYIIKSVESTKFTLQLGTGNRTGIAGGNGTQNVAVLMLHGWKWNGNPGDSGFCTI